ncbi:hypothetical protein GALL_101960 [mine drainage metagenome]|uniref:Uncharacterized protein n=1 Tax=mine drainage metagenome TaxID=410659 RepID=A0A1J5SGJ0_9ZZZZ
MSGATSAFRKEKERLRKTFIQSSYECNEKHLLELYISHHQHELTRFSNIIYGYQSNNSGLRQTYISCMDGIEELLQFMQHDFKAYFVKEAAVTDHCRYNTEPVIKKYMLALRKLWKQNNIDEALQKIVLSVFEECLHDKNSCTYQRLDYLKQLYAVLAVATVEATLIQQLYNANFNDDAFLNYCINSIKNLLQANNKNEVLQLLIASQIKENDQQLIRCGLALHPEEASIKNMIGRWLNAEFYFLELQEPPTAYAAAATKRKGKIKLNLSVDALAYFLFLFEESGIVEATVKKQIFELVATECSSKEQVNIAYKSLLNRSYDVDRHTKETVKTSVIKMLNLINRRA